MFKENLKKEFREWLREVITLTTDEKIQDIKESFNIYESFDSHYDINKIYKNEVVNITFYEFYINKRKYRIFIEWFDGNIHIGFEKEDEFFMNKWYIEGIDNELQNGEIQKLFGTVIYVVKDLYKQKYNSIQIQTNEDKKFRTYLRIIQQISKKLLPDSVISHNDKFIFITNKESKKINFINLFKYKSNKKEK